MKIRYGAGAEATMKRLIPQEDQVCVCGHWWDEHDVRNSAVQPCDVPECDCLDFDFDWKENTPWAIADRGGDPEAWPQHVKDHFGPLVLYHKNEGDEFPGAEPGPINMGYYKTREEAMRFVAQSSDPNEDHYRIEGER